MNIKKILGLLVCLPLISAGNLFAGDPNTLDLVDTAGIVGGTVDVKVYWTDLGTPSDTVDFRIAFNESEFTFNSCTNFDNGWTFFGCSQTQGPGTVNVAVLDPPGPITGTGGDGPQHLFTVTFNVVTITPGSYNIIVDPTYNDFDPDPDPVVTTDGEPTATFDSQVDILGPAYNSINGYAPFDPIPFGSHTTGDANPSEMFDIDNIGEMGTSLDGTCSVIGPDAAAFPLISGASFNVMEAGPNQTVEVQCDSLNLMPGAYGATLQCLHNGGPPGAVSPVDYALSCTILAAPAPNYASTPTPGSLFDFGQNLTTDPNQDLMITITNDGNLDGLNGACTISNSAGGVFTIDNAMNYGPLAQMASAMRTVTCSTAAAGDFVGELSCTAEPPAANAGTFLYPLNCSVTSIPTYSSVPADGVPLTTLTPTQGNGPESTNLDISNTGEALSVLDGSCVLNGTDPEITFVGGNTFSIAAGANQLIGVQCEGDVGNYTNNLACTANAPASNAGTFNYPVNCTVGQPDPATYVSTPYAGGNPGALIDLNEGAPPPPVNNGVPVSTVLTISNGADPGDDFLDLQGCTYSGDTHITASPDPLVAQLDPGQSTDVTFTCDTDDVPGIFTGTYTCPFDENPTPPPPPPAEGGGSGIMSPATYPVECEVREQFSDVSESPASGTPQTAELMPGEQTTFSFTFTENIDEMLDGEVDCSLASGTDFAITAGGPFPATVPSGGSTQVDVTFTDPGAGDLFTDTLNCTMTDNPDGGEPETEDVSWPLEVTVIGRNATFVITKDFNDDNPLGVEVTLDCNTGLPLMQTGTVHDPDAPGLMPGQFTELQMIVVDFDPGTLNCDVFENPVPNGYAVSYDGEFGEDGVATSAGETDDACVFTEIVSADFTCEITNELQTVDLVVNKEWIDDNPGFNLPLWVEIEVRCDNVQDLDEAPLGGICDFDGTGSDVCFTDYIDPNNPGVYGLFPHWDGSTSCSVTEMLEPGVEGDVSDCQDLSLTPGNGAECTIVNTRLYEGIPTLSQYGLLLMALMMLGVGLVGFRRYS